jgi:hypothetical protein
VGAADTLPTCCVSPADVLPPESELTEETIGQQQLFAKHKEPAKAHNHARYRLQAMSERRSRRSHRGLLSSCVTRSDRHGRAPRRERAPSTRARMAQSTRSSSLLLHRVCLVCLVPVLKHSVHSVWRSDSGHCMSTVMSFVHACSKGSLYFSRKHVRSFLSLMFRYSRIHQSLFLHTAEPDWLLLLFPYTTCMLLHHCSRLESTCRLREFLML